MRTESAAPISSAKYSQIRTDRNGAFTRHGSHRGNGYHRPCTVASWADGSPSSFSARNGSPDSPRAMRMNQLTFSRAILLSATLQFCRDNWCSVNEAGGMAGDSDFDFVRDHHNIVTAFSETGERHGVRFRASDFNLRQSKKYFQFRYGPESESQ